MSWALWFEAEPRLRVGLRRSLDLEWVRGGASNQDNLEQSV